MSSFNKVILAGHITRDPEVRYTPKGTTVAKFALAMNREWKDTAGNEREEVTFCEVEAWGREAEVIGEHCKKGRPLLVEGRLKQESWVDKETQEKRSRLIVSLEAFTFIGGKKAEAGKDGAQ